MPTSARLAIPTPVAADPVNIPTHLLNMATVLDAKTAIDDQGVFTSRPVSTPGSPGIRGRYYYATDTAILYRDHGTGWIQISPTNQDIHITDWFPQKTNDSSSGYTDFNVNGTRDLTIAAPGWLTVHWHGIMANILGNTGYGFIRLVPKTAANAVDTTIAQYDKYGTAMESEAPAPFTVMGGNITAHWFIPSARSMKVAVQYKMVSSGMRVNEYGTDIAALSSPIIFESV